MSMLVGLDIDLDNESEDDPAMEHCNNCRFNSFAFCVLFIEPLSRDFDSSGMMQPKRCELCVEATGCDFELEES